MDIRDNTILNLSSLRVGYRTGSVSRSLLPPLSAQINKGETVAIIGENGVGKSTLLRTIAGLQEELEGNVTVNGKNLKDYTRYELARNIGYISTEPVRVGSMSVTDLVRLGRYPHTGWTGKFTGEDQRKVAEAISMAGIESLSRRYINELSDGERQRAMIARVLAQDADILLLDEPTAFLDVRSRYEIVHLLHDLSVRRTKTIIFSTHDLLTAIGESDRVLLLFRDFYALGSPEDMVLNGSFEKLFKDSVVRFNASDASFNFMKKSHGDVYIEGTGMARYWTEKAAARVGFEISGPGSGIKIRILAEGNEMRWLAESGNSRYECRSLYELVNWLKQRIEVN